MNTEDMLNKFEEWILSRGIACLADLSRSDGDYVSATTSLMWSAWLNASLKTADEKDQEYARLDTQYGVLLEDIKSIANECGDSPVFSFVKNELLSLIDSVQIQPEHRPAKLDIFGAAKIVAEYANTCCHRSDGYMEDVYKLTLTYLEAAMGASK